MSPEHGCKPAQQRRRRFSTLEHGWKLRPHWADRLRQCSRVQPPRRAPSRDSIPAKSTMLVFYR